jgi:hypothetical protein
MPDDAAPELPADPPSKRPRRLARALLQGALGLALGLGLVESTFRWRDGGAFPLVNVYEPDPALGVRLEPGTETLVGQRGERVTRVRVNAQGYRGAEWPAPSANEVVVIGDSMSFGLGVEEDEALAARLRAALGRSVIDASVPTYGPLEYLFTLKQLMAARKPGVVVLVLNMLNDFGEIDHPNADRHAALDGWAIRRGPGPVPPSSRARTLAIRHSHAAFALWRWQRSREARAAPPAPDHGARDLLAFATERHAAIAAAIAARQPPELGQALGDLTLIGGRYGVRPRTPLFEMVRKYAKPMADLGRGLWDPAWNAHLDDDILDDAPTYLAWCGWGARTWEEVRLNKAAQLAHRGMTQALRRYAALPTTDPEDRREIEDAAERTEHPKPPEPPKPLSLPPLPIEPFFRDAIAASAGARLVMLIVPLQAQIDPAARERNGLSEGDVAALHELVGDSNALALRLGARVAEPSEELSRLGASAYLPDGHLSAEGHAAVARAVAGAVSAAR